MRVIEQACEFLLQQLAKGPAPAANVLEAAQQHGIHGISHTTLARAKNKLGIRARKTTNGFWMWELPEDHAPAPDGHLIIIVAEDYLRGDGVGER